MRDPAPDSAVRPCVLVPVYNNVATIAGVIAEIRRFLDQVMVVDDGSTDGTQEILKATESITLVRHDHNRGKGAALQSGFDRAADLGFTHVITMDGDGQHTAADLPAFLRTIHDRPEALVLGVRQLAAPGRRPMKSRLLRAHSNFWVWLETGVRTADSQTGFRAYPLAPINALTFKCRKYDFEIEVLVKALWAGTPVVTIPQRVTWGPGSGSHFRPLRDFALVSQLNARLLALRLLLPPAVCAVIFRQTFARLSLPGRLHALLKQTFSGEAATPGRLSVAVGLGVTFGILPIWGFQMLAGLCAAHWLRLNKPLVLAASNISFPAMLPVILYASLVTGGWLLGRSPLPKLFQFQLTPSNAWAWATDYLVGSVVLAVFAGAVTAALVFAAMKISGRTRRT